LFKHEPDTINFQNSELIESKHKKLTKKNNQPSFKKKLMQEAYQVKEIELTPNPRAVKFILNQTVLDSG